MAFLCIHYKLFPILVTKSLTDNLTLAIHQFLVYFTARQRSCGKVMFYSCLSVHRGVCQDAPGQGSEQRGVWVSGGVVGVRGRCVFQYAPRQGCEQGLGVWECRSPGCVLVSGWDVVCKGRCSQGCGEGVCTPCTTPPSTHHPLESATEADGTRPTGMHSCNEINVDYFTRLSNRILLGFLCLGFLSFKSTVLLVKDYQLCYNRSSQLTNADVFLTIKNMIRSLV